MTVLQFNDDIVLVSLGVYLMNSNVFNIYVFTPFNLFFMIFHYMFRFPLITKICHFSDVSYFA